MSAPKINIFEIGEKVTVKITEPNKANVIIKPADSILSEQYRNEALAFRNQAAGFASQTQADAVQTALDRVQTGLDVIATGEDRVQTGADRIQTGLDATATADDRNQTGLDAIATAADRVQTGLDVIAANEAKDDAEAAAAAVANNVDFTGAEDGDLLQKESGIYVPKNPILVNKSLVPFLNSPLAGLVDLDNVFAWDSFNRADGAIGTADSGQTWQNLSGLDYLISGNKAQAANANEPHISAIERTQFQTDSFGGAGSGGIRSSFFNGATSGTFNAIGIFIGKDIDNYFAVYNRSRRITVQQTINGVTSTILTGTDFTTAINFGIYADIELNIIRNISGSRLRLTVNVYKPVIQSYSINLDSLYSEFGNTDLKYYGFISGSDRRSYNNVIMYSLQV